MFSRFKEIVKENKDYLTWGLLLVMFILAYHFIWINKTYTMSEGWAEFYDALIENGKTPYKDFYYHMPPLNLLFDHVIWKLSFGYIIVYRFWRLLERTIIILVIYHIISQKNNSFIGFIAGVLVCITQAANVHDLVGDYNQTTFLMIFVVMLLLLKYVSNINSNKRYVYAFEVGLCGGLMFLMKQPLVFSAVVVYSCFLLILIVEKKERNVFRIILSIVIGAIIPIAIATIWLLHNNCFLDCIQQVYMDTSAKGSAYSIIVEKLLNTFYDNKVVIIITLLLIISNYISANNSSVRRMVLAIVSLLTIYYSWSFINLLLETNFSTGMFYVTTVSILIILVGKINGLKYIPFLSSIILVFVLLICNPNDLTINFAEGGLNSYIAIGLTTIFCIIFIWIVFHLIDSKKQKKEIDLEALVIAFTGICGGYQTIMTNGDTGVVTSSAFTLVPAAIYILCRNNKTEKFDKIIILQIVAIMILIICLSQKLTAPYSWWGDTESSFWEKTESSEIKMLKGFKFSKEEIERYDYLNRVISANTDENSVIWGFPYVKVYNLFQENYNMNGFVPVEFYDVCSDEYAIKEAKLLADNMPDIVVWQDITECIETHEKAYRDGYELGQRYILNWFASVVDTDYTLIGQVDDVFVYKLNNGEKIDQTYTYIRSKHAENVTAKKELKLEGLGCKTIPYQISSYDDLKYLEDYVNRGNNVEGLYFRQICDIDLTDIEDWEPIGNENSNGFAGVYDGNGYSIKGLWMLSDNDEDLALFGKMDGMVINLSIENAWIGGQDIAIIAVEGSGDIINCYASGSLYGYNASGISYSLTGNIENNVAIINVEKGTANGIIGIDSDKVKNCYSNCLDFAINDSGNLLNDTTTDELNEFVDEYNESAKDLYLIHWEKIDGIPRLRKNE